MAPAPTSRWRALAALMRPDRGRWAALGGLVAAGSLLTVSVPVVVRRIVDRASDGASARELSSLAVVVLLIAVATQATAVVVAWFATTTAWRTTNGLRLQMTEHVLGLDHEFHRRHTAGELIQRVDGDVTSVSDFLARVVPKTFGSVVLVAGMIGVLAVLDWRLGLGMAVYVTAALAVVVATRHRAVDESSDEMGSYARLYGGIEERLAASEDLRANGAASHAMWRFIGDSAATLTSSVRRKQAFLTMWWAVQGAVALGTVVALVVSAGLVGIGAITVGTAFLLFQYVLLIGRPLEEVVHELDTVQKATGAMVRVADLMTIEPMIRDHGTTSPPAGALSVSLRGLGFDYGDGEPVLSGVDLEIDAGRSVGIVGRTGGGKTTLSRLVLRLVEATHGELLLGGVPIQEIPLGELRRRVASIPQEVELVTGTIRDNVTLFDPAPGDHAVVDALERVGLDAVVRAGIHRELGPSGVGLSAGEAQLLALARVWLRDPDLIVLDEATARIDPATEARLATAVAELMHGRTTLVIAHRLSTLRRVDDIVVVDDGRVVEQGLRQQLAGDDLSRFRRLLDLANEPDAEVVA